MADEPPDLFDSLLDTTSGTANDLLKVAKAHAKTAKGKLEDQSILVFGTTITTKVNKPHWEGAFTAATAPEAVTGGTATAVAAVAAAPTTSAIVTPVPGIV